MRGSPSLWNRYRNLLQRSESIGLRHRQHHRQKPQKRSNSQTLPYHVLLAEPHLRLQLGLTSPHSAASKPSPNPGSDNPSSDNLAFNGAILPRRHHRPLHGG